MRPHHVAYFTPMKIDPLAPAKTYSFLAPSFSKFIIITIRYLDAIRIRYD